ncbi:MAG: HIT family protein [Planctomycetes bacterium]|nr:HIT family protein [Planctomycetota bacterium]
MADCIFCKIVAGEVPCTKVLEDPVCLVFMDISPISPGHTLLIPKKHYESMMEMPAGDAAHMGGHLPALAAAVKAAAGAEALNVLQNNGRAAGQAVAHLHIHLIPRWAGDGLGFRWPAKAADPAALARQAEAIRQRLGA